MRDIYSGQAELGDSTNTLLLKIWYWCYKNYLAVTGGGGTGTQRTFALTAATSSGSVTGGTIAVAFSSSSDFSGTITGAAFGASQSIGVSANEGDTIGAIAYTRAAGTLYIATLT